MVGAGSKAVLSASLVSSMAGAVAGPAEDNGKMPLRINLMGGE